MLGQHEYVFQVQELQVLQMMREMAEIQEFWSRRWYQLK